MPELPEVETVCRGLRENVVNKKIVDVFTSNKNLRFSYPENFAINLKDNIVANIFRRARYILIYLDSGKVLLIHLGMTGKLNFYQNQSNKIAKHDHIIIKFSDNSFLIYNDVRRFGFADLFPSEEYNSHRMLKTLGLEPLSTEFNTEYLLKQLVNKKSNIKSVMMNNQIVVGVGNIYINESLFLSKISPERIANKVKKIEITRLIKNIKTTLQSAIDKGGSTLRDYQQLNGDVGNFQLTFKVYGKEGNDCLNCQAKIQRIKQNGRSSFFCPSCQK
ncbi:MAG: formamidopyrimidine-DNA glycosylase [Ulvibacter sp.]|jgi:formamidopyrimidine-DNA glycosylase